MPILYGKDWSRDELRRHSGTLKQIAGCTRVALQEGTEKGVEVCDIRTGSGFRFCVSPSRGMDITFAEHNGRPLCWNSSTGWPHPSYFENGNMGWLRGFGGGLLATCGLNSFGIACDDEGEHYGLHDRISYLAATGVHVREEWTEGGEYEISVEGLVRQTRVFGADLSLRRTVTTRLGANCLTVRDRLTNEGFSPAPAVILYHCNFGFPVVSQDSEIRAPSTKAQPRDADAEVEADQWMLFTAPAADYAERCYFHTMTPDARGRVRAEIWNPALEFGGYIDYRARELPDFTQWKMLGAGLYVCGLEPSNAPLLPRDELRARGLLPMLEPGESVDFDVELGAVL